MRARGLFLCICAVLTILAAPGCAGRRADEVLVILRTKSYHTARCPFVNMARTRIMTIAEAQGLNCLPCPRCTPGRME